MPYCLAYGCTSNSVKNVNGVHFHHFPKPSEPLRRKKWILYCRRADLKNPSKYSTLCSRHFSPGMYERDPAFLHRFGYSNTKAKLFKDAVPDVSLVIPGTTARKPTTDRPGSDRKAFQKRRRLEFRNKIDDAIRDLQDRSHSEERCTKSTGADPSLDDEPQDPGYEEPECDIQQDCRKHFQCQVSLAVPKAKLRTRRLQTIPMVKLSRAIQTRPTTRTVATQTKADATPSTCDHYSSEESDMDMDIEVADDISDPTYQPSQSDNEVDSDEEDDIKGDSMIQESSDRLEERFFLVSESSIHSMLSCVVCGPSNTSIQIIQQVGTMIVVEKKCMCGTKLWYSQTRDGKMPLGNLRLASATLLSGSSPAKILNLFRVLNMPIFSRQTYENIQSCYIVPAVQNTWPQYQELLLDQLQGEDLAVGGDARCDSPGYSAKYGSYTLMDLGRRLILDTQLVQCNEVKSSTHMELAGLKRGITLLEEKGCRISELVTDRHLQVQKYMREDQSHITHLYDVWHVAKGVQKKLEVASKKKDCAVLRGWIKSISNHMYWVASGGGNPQLMTEKWTSVGNHISNKHTGHGELYTDCSHGELDQDRDWVREGSRAYKVMTDVVENKRLLKAIPKLSPVYQTYSLEVFHNVVNHFAPKSHHYFYPAMKARIYVAALHFNENSRNTQSTNQTGLLKWRVSYPKAKKGTHSVVKPVNDGPTFEYVDFLLGAILERRTQFPSYKLAREDYKRLTSDDPPFLTSGYEKKDKAGLIEQLVSRYKLNES